MSFGGKNVQRRVRKRDKDFGEKDERTKIRGEMKLNR
jgi:hypothetical protein